MVAAKVRTGQSASEMVSRELPHGNAGVVTRGLAFLIDVGLVVAGTGLFAVIVHTVWSSLDLSPAGLSWLSTITVPSLVFVVYCIVCWSLAGRTIGMAALGLNVVTVKNGQSPGLGRSVVRAVIFLVPPLVLLSGLWIMVDRRRRAWHDRISGTAVRYHLGRRAKEISEQGDRNHVELSAE